MTPFDPARPRTAGNVPGWRDAPMIVLPSLVLTPLGPGQWDLKFMFPSGEHSSAFHWVGFAGPEAEVQAFMRAWMDGPEEAVERLGLTPPAGKWWRLPPKDDPEAELVTAKTAEELGL